MWNEMTLDEFADSERDGGEKIICCNRVWFRNVRYALHRTLYPFQVIPPDTAPHQHLLKCFQYAVPEKTASNSFLNCIVFDNQPDYAIENLSKHQRRYLRAALKLPTELRIIDRPELLYEQGYKVYRSFMGRAHYNYRKERCAQAQFKKWIQAVMKHKKNVVHGAYHEEKLVAIYISCQINDTVFWKAAVNSSEAIQLRTPELILHAYREAASERPDIRQIYCGMLSNDHNQNMFKIRRGARITALPAFHQGNPLMRMLCRLLPSNELKRLMGYSLEEIDQLIETYKKDKSE